MMKLRDQSYILIVTILFLSACLGQNQPLETPLPIVTITQSSTPMLTSELTATPAATKSSLPTAIDISNQCLEIQNDAELLRNEDGRLVIAQDDFTPELYHKLNSPYLYDLATGGITNLSGAYNFSVALDGTKMAYSMANDKLIITDESGKLITQIRNENYIIHDWGIDGLFVTMGDEQAFLNISTGEIKSLEQNYPNLYTVEYGWDHYWTPLAIYDPSLTRVIYPVYDKQSNMSTIALLDVKSGNELARFSDGILSGMKPEWSIDGEIVIIESIEETSTNTRGFDIKILGVHKDGEIQILWQLPDYIGALNYSLSPNKEFLAFWSPDPDEPVEIKNLQLHVLNTKTGHVINYCVTSPFITQQPIWSLDNKSLAVELLQDEENSEVIVVDVENNYAVKIAEDARPVGWLK